MRVYHGACKEVKKQLLKCCLLPPHLFEAGSLLLFLPLRNLFRSGGRSVSGHSPVSTSHLIVQVLGLQACAAVAAILHEF